MVAEVCRASREAIRLGLSIPTLSLGRGPSRGEKAVLLRKPVTAEALCARKEGFASVTDYRPTSRLSVQFLSVDGAAA